MKAQQRAKHAEGQVRVLQGAALKLGKQVAKAWREREVDQKACERATTAADQRAQKVREEADKRAAAAELRAQKTQEEARVLLTTVRELQALKLKLQGQVARAWREAEVNHSKGERIIAALEQTVHRAEAEAETHAHEMEHLRMLKNRQAARARFLERASAGKAATSAMRLTKMQHAHGEVGELRAEVEALKEELLEIDEAPNDVDERGRRDERGRFGALDWQLRELILSELARRTPPVAIAANITDVLRMFASKEVVPLPCVREMIKMRNELTVIGECLAAFRVALAKRIISFGFDESTKFGLGLLSSNTQIEPHDAPGTSVDVVLRGASLTAGGTSEEVAKSVDQKIFSHSRRLLAGWNEAHETLHGKGSWRLDGGPDPSQIGIHRLAEETVVMGDTCNGERKAKRLVSEAAEAAKRLAIGDEAWEAMSEEERTTSCKAYIGDCHDHLRNIIIKAMATGATEMLKDSLEDDLAEFTSYDRMSVDGMDLINAAFKELHPGGQYAKGKGREAKAWREQMHASAMWVPVYNASGNRQDAAFDGSMSLYMNWKLNLDFLHGLVNVPRADNKLELFLWRIHRCNQMHALVRVNTLWKLVIMDAMRWLSGKAHELDKWSLVSADRVLELAEAAFVAIAADGRKLLDANLNPFAEIAALQPVFAAWQAKRAQQEQMAPDGTRHRVYERTLAEARNATSPGAVQATKQTITLAERMATDALIAMHDTRRAIAEKLTSQDGACAPAKRQRMHEATIGAHVNNSRCESIFGSYDYVGHIFRKAAASVLGGLAQQMRNCDFERAPIVALRNGGKRKAMAADAPPAALPVDGFYHRLPSARLRESLILFGRQEAVRARKAEREDIRAHDEAKLVKREERVIELLNRAVSDYAYSKELFVTWQGENAARNDAAVGAYLAEHSSSEAQQLEYLRKQIEMRVLGLGWLQYATRWSSNKDSKVGTVAHLRELLKEILTEEVSQRRLKELPTEAALPQQIRRNLGQLGEVDEDAVDTEKKALFSTEELKRKAEVEMQRRVESGISDTVENLNGVTPPPFDQKLVGKQVEVCWKYNDKSTGEPLLIWATGRIARVADGLTDTRSPRARSVLPAGMVLWAWDADPEFEEVAGEKWLALLPQKWNPSRKLHYGWRFDPREFGAARVTG